MKNYNKKFLAKKTLIDHSIKDQVKNKQKMQKSKNLINNKKKITDKISIFSIIN